MFEEVVISWKGQEYTIPADRIMRLIMKVEDVVTLAKLYQYGINQDVPVAKISAAYGIMLRYCGCKVTDEEIYCQILEGGAQAAGSAVQSLLEMMRPKEQPKATHTAANAGKSKPAAE